MGIGPAAGCCKDCRCPPALPVAWLQTLKLLLLWLLAGAVQAQDDPPGRVGRLAALQGEVWVLEPGQGEWVAALPNPPLYRR